MQLDDFCFDGKGTFSLDDYPTNAKIPKAQRERYEALMQENIDRMADLQDRLYAEGREGVVIMFQAMDAAGKDSTELAHDFLWRAVTHLPRRGYIGLFNRSYYEDVLVVRVHQMQHNYAMPKRTTDMSEAEFFSHRHRQIRDFERYLWENGYRLVKIMLNVSEKEQAKRFLERIDNPAKNWKFSSSDLAERALWPKYRAAFTQVIGETATPEAPWYVIPADQKWFARYLVSEAVVRVLTECDPQYPKLAEDQLDKLAEYRRQLTAE